MKEVQDKKTKNKIGLQPRMRTHVKCGSYKQVKGALP